MSDYLNNLVARSLSVADVVQPRVPHLFEQSAAATPVPAEPYSANESVAETMVTTEAPKASYETPVAQLNPEVATPLLEQFRPAPITQATVPPPAPAIAEPVTEMPTRNIEPAQESSMSPVPPRVPVTQQQRTLTHHTTKVAEAAVTPTIGPSHRNPSVTVRRSERVTPNHKPHVPISPAAPLVNSQHNHAEPQLPPIKINIGRVDVRAIMPAAPPSVPGSPRPKPALSLESYLKQREEGKR